MQTIELKATTHDIAAANILRHVREGRLVQNSFHGEQGGRQVACLLGAIHPDINSTGACPAALMPAWLARLTVRLFDGLPSARIAEYGEAYAERLHRWGALSAEAWARLRVDFITEVFSGAIARAEGRLPDPRPESWAPVKACADRLLAALVKPDPTYTEISAIRDEAWELRNVAWKAYDAARRRRAAAAAAAAAEAVAAACRYLGMA